MTVLSHLLKLYRAGAARTNAWTQQMQEIEDYFILITDVTYNMR
ncbi:MAG: hypothetical protein AB8G77_26450 [Rhodothermales bacterium]